MSLVVAAPPRGEPQAATWMARAAVHSTEEIKIYNRASYEALVARFDSASARGVATVLPRETPLDKSYLDETGFQRPLLIKTPAQADLLVPAPNSLSLHDLATAIGSERPVRAIDVASQHELTEEWKLKQWMAYFGTPAAQRERVLNLISLECSGTKLETLVRPPKVVREIGWVERHWPPKKDKLPAPKVSLYCLMSAAGSYTEFHIDFGGSSVWYHLHQGRKLFFVVPPTDDNLARFAQFEGQYEHGQAPFFGDLVARGDCTVIEMQAGDTMLLPSGWIHAVYTPEDSISFGGNFLSSYHVGSHLRCHRQELVHQIEGRFHFPDFECAVWYAAAYYGKMLSTCPSLLTKWEWFGLRDLVPALEEWLASATTDPLLVERVAAICKLAVRATPSAMLAKMRVTVDAKMTLLGAEDDDKESGGPRAKQLAAPPFNSLSRGAAGHSSSSSSSSSPESSSESSESSSDDSDDDTGHGSDHDRQATDDDGNANGDNSNSSDSSSDDDSSSSSSSSDEEDNEERKEPEDTKEPEQEKEAEEEGELDEPEESSSSESDNDDDPDPENAYPELPPVPIEALIAIRKRAKLKDLQITKAGKEHVVALAHQHRLEVQHPAKNKKKTKPVAAEAAVITPWAEEDRWTVACSCGLGGENYDDGRMMVECNNCNNWVHGECVRIPIQEIFWCFKCRSPESNDWLFVCPCGIKEKNYDDGARMVQCDNCEIWQHTYCAGIPDTEDPPEKFMCKICSKAPKKPRVTAKTTQKKTKKKAATSSKAKQQTQAGGVLSPMSKLVAAASETVAVPIPKSPSKSPAQGMSPPPPPPPPPSAPPSPTPVVDSIEEEAYSPPKQRKRGRTSSKSKSSEKSRKRPQKEEPTGAHEIPPSPAGVHGVSAIVQRPPLPNQTKSSSKSAKRKSGGGSARDRLEKKLKIRKPRL